MEENANTELVRSHVDTIILKTLQTKDSYPYEILREIEDRSEGKYVLKQATLYSCMKRLEKLGYINSYWGTESEGGRRRYYSLTELGTDFLNRDQAEWEFSRTLINRLLSDREIDLDTVTPPFDASSLRPLTKRGALKAAESKNTGLERAVDSENEKAENTETPFYGEFDRTTSQSSSSVPEADFSSVERADGAETRPDSEKTDGQTGNIAGRFEKFSDAENFNATKDDETVYFTKEPVFQHSLPEEDRNSTASGSAAGIRTSGNAAGTKTAALPEDRPIEETEDMKTAANLLHIGRNFRDREAFMERPARSASTSERLPNPQREQRAEENYRDVLNRIFDTEASKSTTEPVAETAAAIAPTEASLSRGKHLKDLQTVLEKQGYQLKIYSPKNRSDYYYNKYVYQNKLNFATNLILFLIMAVEFIAVIALNGLIGFRPLTLALSGAAIALPPILFLILLFLNPTKRVRANYNFMPVFLYRCVFAFILIAVDVIVCLLTPALGIGFSDARMYLPWLFALDIPLYAVVYHFLYRTKRFHLACAN